MYTVTATRHELKERYKANTPFKPSKHSTGDIDIMPAVIFLSAVWFDTLITEKTADNVQ